MFFNPERMGHSFIPKWVYQVHITRYILASKYVSGKNVVNCACGEGVGSEHLSRAGANMVECFDLSQNAILSAKKRYKEKNIRFRAADCRDLPLEDSSIDVYVSLETIEHIDNDRVFLKEVTRVLRPDGIFICSTPNRTVTNPGTSITDKVWNPYHVREYSKEEFGSLLESAFYNVTLYGQHPTGKRKIETTQRIRKILPPGGAMMVNHVLKIGWLLFHGPEDHTVTTMKDGVDYDCLLAICSKPRK
ncbi:MAG: methyltransferase domain-containing protein [Candidatus Omnitrophota bacterium]